MKWQMIADCLAVWS